MNKIPTKAIIPAAGLGTRFLPQTKAMPKEMLPIVNKPVIQIVVEELVQAGVTEIIIVTGSQKRAIEDHFDRDEELEQKLRSSGKEKAAEEVMNISTLANFVYLRQKRKSDEPEGNALPIRNAMHLLGNEPFYVVYPDDFFLCPAKNSIQQILDVYQETGKSVIQAIEVNDESIERYGVIKTSDEYGVGKHVRVEGLVEKPSREQAPSRLASVSGYILTPEILPIISNLKPGVGGEIGIADAVHQLSQIDEVYAVSIDGTYHDAGNKLSYIQAVIDAALYNDDLSQDLRDYLHIRLQK